MNKKAKFAFQIKGNDGNQWYNTDGSAYNESFEQQYESVKESELKEKIKQLKLKLSLAKKVFNNLIYRVIIFLFV